MLSLTKILSIFVTCYATTVPTVSQMTKKQDTVCHTQPQQILQDTMYLHSGVPHLITTYKTSAPSSMLIAFWYYKNIQVI
jgi:hypothetical protein